MRQGRRLAPTPAGQVYLEAAQQILDLQARAAAAIRALSPAGRTVLPIGVSPHRGAKTLARLFPAFARRFPDIELAPREAYTRELYAAVREGRVPLAMTTCTDADVEGLEMIRTFREDLILCVPAHHPLAREAAPAGEPFAAMDLRRLRDVPFVLMDPETTVGQASAAIFAQAGLYPTVVYRSANVLMVSEMLKAGAGAGLLPAFYAQPCDTLAYFYPTQTARFYASVAVQPGHVLTEAERYILYLQLNVSLEEFGGRVCWSDLLRGIVDEFDDMPAFPAVR